MQPKEVKCPECEQEFELEEDLYVGDISYCPHCEVELRVLKLNPPKLGVIKSSYDVTEDEEDSEFS